MGKPKRMEKAGAIPPDAAPGEYGPITVPEFLALPEDVRQRRIKRVYEKTQALRGKIHIQLCDEDARGRNRR